MEDRHISELSRRIAQAVSPRRVILFGSAARGEFGDRSDLDVWLRRAESSLMLARQDKPESVDWADLCYLAQQAAEKAVKAVYRLVERPHRYTHNLEELGGGLEKAVNAQSMLQAASLASARAAHPTHRH